jgi:LPXTG-motif cell wall-anchored protein
MKYFCSRRQLQATAIILSLALPGLAAASGSPDTSANAMINGGCATRAACVAKLKHGDGVNTARSLQTLYAAHGITVAGISSSETVQGTVTKSGQVIVLKSGSNVTTDQVIATNAQSFGRSFISGSTKVASIYERPTSVAFVTDQLPALVHLHNGRFEWAIVESCGNIVVATPKITPATVKPAVQMPTPVPAPTVSVVQIQTQTQTQTPAPAVVASTPAPPTPTPTPAAAAQPAAAAAPLPQTGAGILGTAGLSVLLVVAGYYRRSRRSLRLALRRT